MTSPDDRARDLNQFGADRLPALMGLEILIAQPERMTGRIPVTAPLVAGNGYFWAAAVIMLADTLCAYGAGLNLPEGARSFTTVELKTNFLGTASEGQVVSGQAAPVHLGRTTQVWDATVVNDSTGRTIALFRCTQMLIYPPPSG